MKCSECGKQYRNVKRCVICHIVLCPFCVKSYKEKSYCSDCLTNVLNKRTFFDRYWNYNINNLGEDLNELADIEEVKK